MFPGRNAGLAELCIAGAAFDEDFDFAADKGFGNLPRDFVLFGHRQLCGAAVSLCRGFVRSSLRRACRLPCE